MQSVTQVIENISESAKPRQDMRIIPSIKHGQMIRQGDIYLISIGNKDKVTVFNNVEVSMKNYTSEVKTNAEFFQLVPGSTMGSRHQVRTKNVKLLVNPTSESTLVGPIIKAEQAFDLVHPEHAHFNLPAGEYLVCYQLNAKTMQRVRD